MSVAALTLPLAIACADREPSDCAAEAERENWEAVITICSSEFERRGDVDAGVLAARGLYQLGRLDQLEPWTERLENSAQEPLLWSWVGTLRRARGDRAGAVSAIERELALHRAAGKEREAADATYRLFYLAWESSDLQRAMTSARQLEMTATRLDDPTLAHLAAMSRYLVHYEVGDLDGADLALREADSRVSNATPTQIAERLVNRGVIALDRRRYGLARELTERAVAVARPLGDAQLLRSAHLNVVEASLALGDTTAARRHLEQAATWAEATATANAALAYYRACVEEAEERFADASATAAAAQTLAAGPQWRWRLATVHGRTEQALGRSGAAVASFTSAIEALEAMAQEVPLDSLKPWLQASRREPYERLFLLAVDQRRWDLALEVVERAKLAAVRDRFMMAAPEAAATPAKLTRDRVDDQVIDRATGLERLFSVLPTPHGEVDRDRLRIDDGTALVYFFAGSELWMLRVDSKVVAVKLAPSPEALERMVDDFRADPANTELAAALGEALLPKPQRPPAGERLLLAPEGPLLALPFAALRVDGSVLVERNELLLIPSLTFIARAAAARDCTAEGARPALIVGDPLGDLPGARLEAEAVARRLGVEPLTGAAAERERIVRAGREPASAPPRLVHFATHGGLDSRGPWLQLADGRLYADEIVTLGLAGDTVVLASCDAAVAAGPTTWSSLAAAFVAAGAHRVIAPLGSIEDRAARELVRTLYDELDQKDGLGHRDGATALGNAQRAMARSGRPAEEWAFLVTMGIREEETPCKGNN